MCASFLWHVRAGTLQLEAGQVLRSDPFSFITLGESWRTQSWLAEIGYGWAEQTTGSLQWMPTMMFLVMGATLAFVGIAVYRTVLDPAKTALGVVAVAWVGMLFVVPRPVIFSFLFLAVFVVVLGHPDRLGWTLVPLSWLWAAVHGLFVLGLTLVALETIRRRSWRLMGIGAASGAVTLLTAHGLGVVQILLDFVENREALAYLSEWKRPDLLSLGLVPSIAVGAGLIAGIARRRLEISHLFVVLPFVALGGFAAAQRLPRANRSRSARFCRRNHRPSAEGQGSRISADQLVDRRCDRSAGRHRTGTANWPKHGGPTIRGGGSSADQ